MFQFQITDTLCLYLYDPIAYILSTSHSWLQYQKVDQKPPLLLLSNTFHVVHFSAIQTYIQVVFRPVGCLPVPLSKKILETSTYLIKSL